MTDHDVRTSTVTVLGFGAMGNPMTRLLRAAGHTVLAVDPNPEARERAESEGIPAFPDIGTTPASEVVLVLVATGDQVLDAARNGVERTGIADETWILSSTVGPDAAREAAALLTEAGAGVVDAPVTGGVPGAEAGTLRFLTAGTPRALDAVSHVLPLLGTTVVVGERPGDGQATKLVNQLCSSIHLAAAAEAIALATRLGLDPVRTVEVMSGGSGASWFFDDRGPRMARLGEDQTVLTRLAILAKDNSLTEQQADSHQAHVPLLKAAKAQYLRAAELGLLDADDSAIIRTYLG
jgi:3-hydroxyisobutyrate dehydrogenase